MSDSRNEVSGGTAGSGAGPSRGETGLGRASNGPAWHLWRQYGPQDGGPRGVESQRLETGTPGGKRPGAGLRHERVRRNTAAMTRASARLWALRTVFRTVGPLAPGLAARWAETLFCTPPRHQARPGEEAFLASGRRSSARWEGGELAVWEWGHGPSVLLVH